MAGETLSAYLVRTRRLLKDLAAVYTPDPTNHTPAQFYSDYDLTQDINDAAEQRDLWSGGSRSYQQNIPLTIGQDRYVFTTMFPALTAANQTVLDVITIWLIYGSTRVALHNPPFSTLTDKARALVGYQNRPWGWSRYGANQIYIAPAPGAAYTADFDLSVLATRFAAVTDPDPLPFPYTTPIPFYAAYLAQLNMRRFDQAEVLFGYYVRAMRDIEGARVGEMLSAYSESGRGRRS